METLFSTIYVNSLILNKEYSLSGKEVILKLSDISDINITVQALSNIRILSNLQKIKTIKEFFYNFFKTLNIKDFNFNYSKLLGFKKSNEYHNYLKKEIEESLKLITTYHTKVFPLRKRNYLKFNTVYLDDKLLEKPVYDHAGVTGRTSIKKGFNFLTLKKDKRKMLKSSCKEKVLVEIDFKSCEPFFYLKSQGFNIDSNDIYKWLSEKYDIEFSNRERIKRGILSMIYGANEYTISKIMKVKESKILEIKKDLKILDLKQNLEKEFNKNGFIFNYYGRPITSNNNVVNYWIQSSAVDYCSLAFEKFCKDNKITPSFFIHDSMTFEIEKSKLKQLLTIKEIKDTISQISIPVEYTILSE